MQTPAPFGLRWGVSPDEIRSLGIELSGGEEGSNGACYVARNVPKPISDVETVLAFFTNGGKLWRVVAAFKLVQNDPYGVATEKRYGELKEALSSRYGAGEESRLIQSAYSAENFVLGISTGDNQLFCNFSTSELFVQLAMRAGGLGESFCMIFYESRPLKAEFEAEQRQREIDAL